MGICDNCTCVILHADICIECGIINVITPGDIFWTKSSNSGHINIKDNTWQDSNTRDRY
ncbi:hypothetical protein PQG02_24210 [Nostoc sp. UHCC 0926]|nr:hypothetical protein PQG02_24210 [Nostoc sp. UHCC 0926]